MYKEKCKKHKIRECHVAIIQDPRVESVAWLKRNERNQRKKPVAKKPESAGPCLNHFQPAPISGHRRGSVATGSNLFVVNGSIEEFGFDHLQRVGK